MWLFRTPNAQNNSDTYKPYLHTHTRNKKKARKTTKPIIRNKPPKTTKKKQKHTIKPKINHIKVTLYIPNTDSWWRWHQLQNHHKKINLTHVYNTKLPAIDTGHTYGNQPSTPRLYNLHKNRLWHPTKKNTKRKRTKRWKQLQYQMQKTNKKVKNTKSTSHTYKMANDPELTKLSNTHNPIYMQQRSKK